MTEYDTCSICLAELASVELRTELGQTRVGPKCSRLLEQLAKLMGVTPKRTTALRLVK